MTMTSATVLAGAHNGTVNDPDDAVDPAAKPTRRSFSVEFKNQILDEYDAADSQARGALLRREGLYTSHISGARGDEMFDQLAERRHHQDQSVHGLGGHRLTLSEHGCPRRRRAVRILASSTCLG